jgi:hypothetical protein
MKSEIDPAIVDADLRTLRLATPELNAARIEKFLAYQRRLAKVELTGSAHAFSHAHEHALEGTGLSAREVAALEAVVRDYCGRRWTALQLEQRLANAKRDVDAALQAGRQPDKRDLRVIDRVPQELPGVSDLSRLERRYGAELIGLLRARESELIALHREIGQRLVKP